MHIARQIQVALKRIYTGQAAKRAKNEIPKLAEREPSL
jgi:hypothetical protein